MEKISNAITDFYIRKNYVPQDKREIYSYGFQLILADIINFSIVILLGMLLNRIIDSILFLITLCSVRQFSGGFHAKTFWLCRLSMLITFLGVIVVSQLLSAYPFKMIISLILNVFCIIFIAALSPIRHSNKELTTKQKKQNKTNAILTSFIMSVISIILLIAGFNKGVTISITLVAVTILMVIGILVQEGGD